MESTCIASHDSIASLVFRGQGFPGFVRTKPSLNHPLTWRRLLRVWIRFLDRHSPFTLSALDRALPRKMSHEFCRGETPSVVLVGQTHDKKTD
jgi:hypothetical protein